MFENVTFEKLLQRILDRMRNGVDKREGSIAYDTIAPVAIELQNSYINLNSVLSETYADTASKYFLIKRCNERGINITPASYAVRQGEFNIDVPIGSRFSLNELNYIVTEQIDTGLFRMRCETPGVVGNAETGSLIPVDYIEGLESATLTDVLIPGEDEEDIEHLRQRYFDSFKSQAFGGNIADYKEKINAIDGVGGVKIYRAFNGGGTVKAVIVDGTFAKPSDVLVNEVQRIIDPIENQGEGLGLAPIGHKVTVVGCGETVVNVQTKITIKSDWTWSMVELDVQKAIDEYFTELAKNWEDSDKNALVVRISQIETRLLDIDGIIDISNTLLNGVASNLSIDKDNIPVRGSVTNE